MLKALLAAGEQTAATKEIQAAVRGEEMRVDKPKGKAKKSEDNSPVGDIEGENPEADN